MEINKKEYSVIRPADVQTCASTEDIIHFENKLCIQTAQNEIELI